MKEEILKDAKFNVEIKTPSGININEKDLSYGAAQVLCEHVLEQNTEDNKLQEQLKSCMDSFGFRGFGGDGYSITISAYKPVYDTEEEHECPQRMQGPFNLPDKDTWTIIGEDKCCSYCGSLHPDRVLELVEKHGFQIIEQTSKSYKWYINQPNVSNASFGGIKYYRYHDTQEFVDKLNQLFKKTKQS